MMPEDPARYRRLGLSLVKVGEETIADAEFYRRLFVLIENLAE